ncbi:MAG TPA: polyprenyl diphosphate synthase, partial [Candidatus Glassbacteria bacterium]|nr:polyprenyl diphosphate synthase [Candidatus Glassbacteria bacterium]
IRLNCLGRLEKIDAAPRRALEEAMRITADCKDMVLNLAISYGSRSEIVDAARRLCARAALGELDPQQVDERTISDSLYTAGLPDPDLLIRTSGEMRISNFLLWQIAYTEIYITSILWPDFNKKALYEAVAEFQKRDRRFGRVKSKT